MFSSDLVLLPLLKELQHLASLEMTCFCLKEALRRSSRKLSPGFDGAAVLEICRENELIDV